MAHVNVRTIQQMESQQLVEGLSIKSETDETVPVCTGCVYGKMHRLPFPTGRIRAKEVGELIHSDVCGPMQEKSLSGARFYVLFKDDCSGW